MTAVLLTFFLLIIQTTLLKTFGWMTPDMALIAAVYCGRKYGRLRGYRFGIVMGVMQDLFSFGLLGVNLFSKGLIGLVSGLIRESNVFDPRSMTTWMVFLLAFTVLNELIGTMYSSGPFGSAAAFAPTAYTIAKQSILNVTAGYLLFYIMDRIVNRLKRSQTARYADLPGG
ncbi:MAG: rod shape-determining protein MreD [Nitrospinota bacterium]